VICGGYIYSIDIVDYYCNVNFLSYFCLTLAVFLKCVCSANDISQPFEFYILTSYIANLIDQMPIVHLHFDATLQYSFFF
jgi:hypothetical protein